MDPKVISTIGLTTGVSLGLQNGTIINDNGKTVTDHNREVEDAENFTVTCRDLALF